MRRLAAVVALLGGLSVVGACAGGAPRPVSMQNPPLPQPEASPLPTASGPTTGGRHTFSDRQRAPVTEAWVGVPVATLWNQPGSVRPVDEPVDGSSPDVARWLRSMSLPQKLQLDNIMATQALMDEPLTVIEVSGPWADVLVQDQTGSVYPDGVEGWMPVSQITFDRPTPASTYVTVSQPVADAAGLHLSYGTKLPVVGSTDNGPVVATPYGDRVLRSTDVRTNAPPPSPQAVLREAEKFLGLPYLWAGTSSYGFDCSGLTYSVYKQFGIQLARDAGDQAHQGRAVSKDELRPGDLMFFAWGGVIDHVGIYAGNGMMLHAPETGSKVQLINIWSSSLARNYAGARRYFG